MNPHRRRWTAGSAIAVGAVVLPYFLPLFHVVPFRSGERSQQAGPSPAKVSFEPVAFVDEFWKERLIPGAESAVDASTLITAIAKDPKAARKLFGRSVGLGSTYYFSVAGTGRVASVEKNSIGLSLEEGSDGIQLSLAAGNIFCNAVRDGTGLLDVNNFNNTQDFNAVSSEINRRIESEVLPALRDKAAVGVTIRFVGCIEITDESTDLNPLRVIPFIVEAP